MKRLVLALLLLAVPAHAARIAVVKHMSWAPNAADQPELTRRMNVKFDYFQSALKSLGVDYTVIDACSVPVIDSQTGIFPSTTAKADTFAAVIQWNTYGLYRTLCGNANYDSLTLAGGYPPKVPQLFLFTNQGAEDSALGQFDSASQVGGRNPDTTGVNRPTSNSVMSPLEIDAVVTQRLESHFQPGFPECWIGSSYVGNCEFNPTPPAGGVRNLLSYGFNSLMKNAAWAGVNSWNPDSAGTSAATETTVVWQRLMSHVAGAKPITFAWYQGGSDLNDSTGSNRVPCETEWPTLMVALAALDTLTNHGVFGRQLAFSITIDGGASRCGRRNPWGMFAPDSSVHYAVIDSFASRHLPAVLAFKKDSAATYASEMNHWRRWPELRYTPWYDFGSDTYALQSAANLKAARYQVAASYPISGTCIPLMEDWSPSSFPPPDSVLTAIAAAGFTALRVDGQKPRRYFGADAKGYGAEAFEEGRRSGLTLVAHGGNSLSGGAVQWCVMSDSTPPYVSGMISSSNSPIAYEQARWWSGLLCPNFDDYDFVQYDQFTSASNADMPWWAEVDRSFADKFYRFPRAHVIRLGVNDLGGIPNGPPARWGWWAVKSMDNAFRIINRRAGRVVCKWTYPEDVLQ